MKLLQSLTLGNFKLSKIRKQNLCAISTIYKTQLINTNLLFNCGYLNLRLEASYQIIDGIFQWQLAVLILEY